MKLNKDGLTPITSMEEDKAYVVLYPGKGPQGNVPHVMKVEDFRTSPVIYDLDTTITSAEVLTSGVGASPVTVLTTPTGYFADWLTLKVYQTNSTEAYTTNTTAHLYQGFISLVGAIDLENTTDVYSIADLASATFYGEVDSPIQFTTLVGNPAVGDGEFRVMGTYVLRPIYGT